jgi:hypothetical protein
MFYGKLMSWNLHIECLHTIGSISSIHMNLQQLMCSYEGKII